MIPSIIRVFSDTLAFIQPANYRPFPVTSPLSDLRLIHAKALVSLENTGAARGMKFLRPEIRKEARFHRYLPPWNLNGVRFRAFLIVLFLSDSHFFSVENGFINRLSFLVSAVSSAPLCSSACLPTFFLLRPLCSHFICLSICLQRSSERRISIHRVHDRSLNRQVSRNACAVHIDVTLLISTRCLTLFALHQSEWHYDRTLYLTKDREMFSWVCWLIPQYRFE